MSTKTGWRVLASAGVALVALTAHGAAPALEEQTAERPPQLVSSRVIVKFRPAAADKMRAARDKIRGSGVARIDNLNGLFKVKKIRALYPQLHMGMPGAPRTAKEQATRNSARFRQRGARGGGPAAVPALENTYVLELGDGVSPDLAAAAYALAWDAVAYAEPEHLLQVAWIPDDPFYSSHGTWGQSYDDLWGLKANRLDCEPAWDTARGGGIVVAVVDTGIDRNHEDIGANIWMNAGEIAGNGVDDDGNGYVDDVYGWDFATGSGDNDPADGHGHGTHCAGTIGAVADNGLGIVGVAPEVRVMAVKGLSDAGSGSDVDLAQCVYYAVNNGADVLSNSYGGPGYSQTMADAFEYAHANGCVSVAAAGNANSDVSGFMPANIECVIKVAATDANDVKASFSNYGWTLDVAAPGVDILSLRAAGTSLGTAVNSLYTRANGTSMACPHAAGMCALIMARTPGIDPDTVRAVLRATSDDLGAPGMDELYGYGRINAHEAMRFDVSGLCFADIDEPTPGYLPKGVATVAVRGSAYGATFVRYTLDYFSKAAPGDSVTIVESFQPVIDGELGTWDAGSLADGQYVIRLRVLNAAGNEFTSSVGVTIDNVTISAPLEGQICNNKTPLPVRGSAVGEGFQHYMLESAPYAPSPAWSSAGMMLADNGLVPKNDELLGTFDTATIPASGAYLLRLTASYAGGRTEFDTIGIEIDTTLMAGWPVSVEEIVDFYTYHKPHFNFARDASGETCPLVTSGDSVYLYRTDGSFVRRWVIDPYQLHYAVASADLDGDGTDDFVTNMRISGNNGVFSAFRLDGASLPGWPVSVPLPGGAYGLESSSPAVGDLDGDGVLDVVCNAYNRNYNGVNTLALYAIRANGQVLPGWPVYLVTDLPASESLARTSPALADLNGDGRLEVVFGTAGLGLRVFGHDGTPLSGWMPPPEPVDVRMAPAIGDFEPDDAPEIVIGSSTGKVYAFQTDGSLVPGWPVTVDRKNVNEIALADLDRDGDLEIVFTAQYSLTGTGATEEKLYVYHHDGVPAAGWPQSLGNGQHSSVPIAGDIDGDGFLEIIACKDWHGLGAFKHTGQLLWTKDLGYNAKGGNRMMLVDADGDGVLELFVGNDDGLALAWKMSAPAQASGRSWPIYKSNSRFSGCQPLPGHPPVLSPTGDKSAPEGALLTFIVSATDADGDKITYSAAPLPAGATFTDDADGNGAPDGHATFSWTPSYTQAGTYPVTLAASDGQAGDSETITITVANVNRPPVAGNDSAVTDEDIAVTINVLANDADEDGDPLAVNGVTQGSHGSVTINAAGTVTYAPGLDFNGADSFTYTVGDGQGGTAAAVVNVAVTSVNDLPAANAGPDQSVDDSDHNGSHAVTLNGSASQDPDGQIVSYQWKEGPTLLGSAAVVACTLATGVHNIVLTVTDNEGGASTDTVIVTVTVGGVDKVRISKAEYVRNRKQLRVDAYTDTRGAVLTVSGYGQMTYAKSRRSEYRHKYQKKPAADPLGTVTVTSSEGGTATAAVQYR